MEAGRSSETLLNFNQAILYHIQEDGILHGHPHDSLRSHEKLFLNCNNPLGTSRPLLWCSGQEFLATDPEVPGWFDSRPYQIF
jgi:hypothetical protein